MTDFPSTPPMSPPTTPATGPPMAPPGPPRVVPSPRATSTPRRSGSARTVIGVIMVFLAGVSATFGVAAFWTQSELLDSNTWVATSKAIVSDPQVQNDVATAIATQIVESVGVEAFVKNALPAPLSGLSGSATDAATKLIATATAAVVRTDAFVTVWDAAVRAAHEEFVHAVDGSSRLTELGPDGISLNVGAALEQVNQQLQQSGIDVLDSVDLSAIDIKILLIDAPGLDRIRTWVDVLRVASIVFPAIAVLAAISGMIISRRRWLALIAGGVGALVGAVVVEVIALNGRSTAIDQIAGGVLGKGSARVVVDHVMSGLDDAIIITSVVAVIIVTVGIAGSKPT
jgi:hypothetical protein